MEQSSADDPGCLAHKLFGVVERMKADFDAVAAANGLTWLQARTLLSLEQPCPMRSLAEVMSCDASNITGLADRLERLGLIERVPDEHDRRVKLLSLTDEGRQLQASLTEQVAREASVVARLSPPERAQLEALVDKLLAD